MRVVAVGLAMILMSASAGAAEWTADPAASKLAFSGTQLGQTFRGQFGRFTARISFDPTQPQAGHADIVVDLTSAATGDSQRDTALPQPEWFDAKTNPQAVFHVASFAPKGGDAYQATGKLTLRGVTADLSFPFTLTLAGDDAHATGHVDLLRSTFGVGQGAWASDQYVAFQVGVDFDLTAHKIP